MKWYPSGPLPRTKRKRKTSNRWGGHASNRWERQERRRRNMVQFQNKLASGQCSPCTAKSIEEGRQGRASVPSIDLIGHTHSHEPLRANLQVGGDFMTWDYS
jgi:hypothetical protein